eukprot:1273891-Prymnesium_polylepis.2
MACEQRATAGGAVNDGVARADRSARHGCSTPCARLTTHTRRVCLVRTHDTQEGHGRAHHWRVSRTSRDAIGCTRLVAQQCTFAEVASGAHLFDELPIDDTLHHPLPGRTRAQCGERGARRCTRNVSVYPQQQQPWHTESNRAGTGTGQSSACARGPLSQCRSSRPRRLAARSPPPACTQPP